MSSECGSRTVLWCLLNDSVSSPVAPVGSNSSPVGEDANEFQLRSIKLPPKELSFGGTRARVKRNYSRNVGYCPVPVSVTDALVAGVATFTCNVAFLRPLEVGANVTLTVQNAPAARLVPQLLFCVY
jgi:hypothetical protein